MLDIIPAIDLIDGQCVRLKQGDYAQKTTYNSNPLEVARQFEDAGIHRLHLVDLDGAKTGKVVNLKILEKICSNTNLIVDFGGGIKTESSMDDVFSAGAAMITVGSLAVQNKELFLSCLSKYGANRLILAADVRANCISVSGWQEDSQINIIDFLNEYITSGVTQVLCTDISKDGMLEGVNIELYKKLIESFPDTYFIASGGIASTEDFNKLKEIKIPATVIGKAFYEGHISLAEVMQHAL